MFQRFVICLIGLSACATVCVAQTTSTAPDEKTLWTIWKMTQDTPDDHAAIITACKEFKSKMKRDPLVVVTDGIAAWHNLKSGNISAAAQLLTPMISGRPSTPLRKAANYSARSWLTRVDMEGVKQALEIIYSDEIEYPKSLDPLKMLKKHKPRMEDRWGRPWSYSLASLKYLIGISGQKYTIRSPTLGYKSDFAKALKIPYGSKMAVRPLSMGRDKVTIRFVTTDEKKKTVYIALGATRESITIAYIGKKLIVASNGDHWKIMPKPRTGR